jgi:hypothetical protein
MRWVYFASTPRREKHRSFLRRRKPNFEKIETKDRHYFSRVPERRKGNTNLIWQCFFRLLAGVGNIKYCFLALLHSSSVFGLGYALYSFFVVCSLAGVVGCLGGWSGY